jgi:DNA-binding winged helix-turn-helix (wHTH) protein/Tfp pilus assembly protein PilF
MQRLEKHFYEFGEFRIDTQESQLLRAGRSVALTPKLFDLLLLLVENKGHTITKEEVMQHVWPGTFVEENNLSRNISMLRKLLGDNHHDSRFIKTIPKRGYRFETDVHEVFEDEEELIIEKRSRYSVAIGAEAQTARFRALLSTRFVITGFVIAVSIVAALAWAAGSRRQSVGGTNAESEKTAAFRGATKADAVDLYRRGRELWQNRSAAGLHEATLLLEQAVEKDPGFAIGHAALADAYAFDSGSWKNAEGAARRAIELDPSAGEPYATIGFVKFFWELHSGEAEGNLKKAVSLSPNYATGHQWYSLILASNGEFNQALSEMERAHALEPGSIAINTDMCQMLYFLQRFDEAEAQCIRTLQMDPKSYNANTLLSYIYTAKGMYPEAVEAFLTSERLTVNSSTLPEHLPVLQRAFDKEEFARFG